MTATSHISDFLYRLAARQRAPLRDDDEVARAEMPFGSPAVLTVGDLRAALAALEQIDNDSRDHP